MQNEPSPSNSKHEEIDKEERVYTTLGEQNENPLRYACPFPQLSFLDAWKSWLTQQSLNLLQKFRK